MPLLERGRKLIDGRFVIEELLGHGAMGAVYLAREVGTNNRVAIKVLLDNEESAAAKKELAQRFRDEGLAASRLSHPALVKFIERGDDKDVGPYIILQYVAGENLRAFIKRGEKMTWTTAFEQVGRPILSALALMHRAGIVHRDVKPGNIIARADGSVVLADLGLAAFDEREAKTKTGLVVGTPGYMPPERLLEVNEVGSPRGDVYALALVLIELTTGRLPFEGINPAERMHNQLRKKVTPAVLMTMGLPPQVAATLSRALQIRPDDRPADATALLKELDDLPQGKETSLKVPKAIIEVGEPKSTVSSPLKWISPILFFLVIAFLATRVNRLESSRKNSAESLVATIGETIEKGRVEDVRLLFSTLKSKLELLKRNGITQGALLNKYLRPIEGETIFHSALRAHCLMEQSKWSEASEVFGTMLQKHRQSLREKKPKKGFLEIDLLLLEGYATALMHQSRGRLNSCEQYEKVFSEGIALAVNGSREDFWNYLLQLQFLRSKNLIEAALRVQMTGEGDASSLLAAQEDMRPALEVMVRHPNITKAVATRLTNWLSWCEEPSAVRKTSSSKSCSEEEYASLCEGLVKAEKRSYERGCQKETAFNREMRDKNMLPTAKYPKATVLEFMSCSRRWHWINVAGMLSPIEDYMRDCRLCLSCCSLLVKIQSNSPLEMNMEKIGWGPGITPSELWAYLSGQLEMLSKRAWKSDEIQVIAIELALLSVARKYLDLLDKRGAKGNELIVENWSRQKDIPSYHLLAAGVEIAKNNNEKAIECAQEAAHSLERLVKKIDEEPHQQREIIDVINFGYEILFEILANNKVLPQFNETLDDILALVEKRKGLRRLEILAVMYRLDSIQCDKSSNDNELAIKLRRRLKRIRSQPDFEKRFLCYRRQVDFVLDGRPSISR